jgi:GxxExxY protein
MVLRPVFFRRPRAPRVEHLDVRPPPPQLPDHYNTLSQNIGAAIEVHRHLGPGFLEKTYEDALALEFTFRGMQFERQAILDVRYKNQPITESVLDFLVERAVVVELKAIEQIHEVHRSQVLSYLKAGKFRLGLVINFNVVMLRDGIARVIL